MHEPEWQFVEASGIPSVGPHTLSWARYRDKQSPVRSFDGLNYLLVTLAPDEAWTYETPDGHPGPAWLKPVARLLARAPSTYHAGELIAFGRSDASIALRARQPRRRCGNSCSDRRCRIRGRRARLLFRPHPRRRTCRRARPASPRVRRRFA